MLGTWEGGWDSGNPTIENSPILVDRDSGSSCWTLGREAGLWKSHYGKQPYLGFRV